MSYLDSASPAPMYNMAMMPRDDFAAIEQENAIDPGMSDEEFQSLVEREIADAISYVDSDVAPTWETSTLYYRGALFGDEQEGRSQVVSRDVHDTVNAILPSLMRVFFGSDAVVEFQPNGPEDVAMAEQQTDYINYIVTRDNPGFSVFWDAFKDALVRKQGWVKYYWDSSLTPSTVTYTGLNEMGLILLSQDLGQKAAASRSHIEFGDLTQDENGISVTVKTLTPTDRARVVSVPNEEVIIDRRATSTEPGCFTLIAHRTLKTRSQLVAMGYTEDDLDNIGSDDGSLRTMGVAQARLPVPNAGGAESSTNNDAQSEFLYVEAFLYADKDGDGIAELHKVCACGSAYKVLHTEQVDDHNLACFPCDPEPHTFFGDSIAEKTMDIQKIKSGVLRGALDSLVLAIHPRTVAGEGVNLADVLNTEIGAVIRATNPANVVELTKPFVGKEAFPMLAYMDEVRENRTGMSKVAQGLDPSALQNTTALAAANQFNKAHEHIEVIARIFAETGMKRLFRGLLKLTAQNQRQARVVNLRNKWVQVDPRAWKTNMDVTCNVALGAGTSREKLQMMMGVLQKQEQQIAVAGPNGPMVGLREYHNALKDTIALVGERNVDKYFRTPQTAPDGSIPMPPPQPPEKIVIEQMRIQADMAKADADRQADLFIKTAELNAKYRTTIEAATIKANTDFLRIAADLKIQESEAKNAKAKEAVN